jgi:hypothetical protein
MSFDIHVTLKAKSTKAILVEDEDGNEVWIPNSQIDDDSEIWEDSELKEEGKLVISEWLATQKGWL